MAKKRSRILFFLLPIIFIILVYFAYYIFFLKDEREEYPFDSDTSYSSEYIEVTIVDFDSNDCEITYCVYNECFIEDRISCSLLETNEYNGFGRYIINSSFRKYKLFPLSKEYLEFWTIEKIGNEEISEQNIFNGIKNLLEKNYIWQIYFVPVSNMFTSINDWYRNEEISFTADYFRSVFVLGELAKEVKDKELSSFFDRELEYLNSNVENIYSIEVKQPMSYVLPLIDEGLDPAYIRFVIDFEIPDYSTVILEDHQKFSDLIIDNSALYSDDYGYITQYARDYKNFKLYNYVELANYSENQMVTIFNNSTYSLYGLCSILDANDSLLGGDFKENLITLLDNRKLELIELNPFELISCGKYFSSDNVMKNVLEEAILKAVKTNAMYVNSEVFIIETSYKISDNNFVNKVLHYNLADNLEYVLYEK